MDQTGSRDLDDDAQVHRMALEIADLAAWDWNLTTGQVRWTRRHYTMEGYLPGEVVPSFEAWSRRIHPDDLEPTLFAINAARRERELYRAQFRVVWPDGQVRWCQARGRFHYAEDGQALRMVGVMRDITELHRAEALQARLLAQKDVLVGEMQHRTRNLLGVVRAIGRQMLSLSDTPDALWQRIDDRLLALARVQGLVSGAGQAIAFSELLSIELGAMGATLAPPHVVLEGPPVRLPAALVQTLALVIHELATNALKYGALSHPAGRLCVTWDLMGEGEAQSLSILWRETGKAAPEPASQGYGVRLIEEALPYQLGAVTRLEFGAQGVSCAITLPLGTRPQA